MVNDIVLSVIVPCYNSGLYIREAISSVTVNQTKTCEIVVVDDGSTDAYTIQVLKEIEAAGHRVVRRVNGGPAAARNTGVHAAKGKYLLLLDSDNKIRPAYMEEGIRILDQYPRVGVVYGKAEFFGETAKPRFSQSQVFDLEEMLLGNYIDACTVIRRRAWEEVGGMDEHRQLIGHEDWDLWIRLGMAGWAFWAIDEVMFDYRIRTHSVITEASKPEHYQVTQDYVHAKYVRLLREMLLKKRAESNRLRSILEDNRKLGKRLLKNMIRPLLERVGLK
jgi:glycosyltransferase involved in cell wall biosynthesis